MRDRDFIYWLNGYFELSCQDSINGKQATVILDHISLVHETRLHIGKCAATIDYICGVLQMWQHISHTPADANYVEKLILEALSKVLTKETPDRSEDDDKEEGKEEIKSYDTQLELDVADFSVGGSGLLGGGSETRICSGPSSYPASSLHVTC